MKLFSTIWVLVFVVITFTAQAQLLNQKLSNDKNGEIILIGECTADAFKEDPFSSWYNEEYSSYKYDMDKKVIDSLKPFVKKIHITLIMGTWCSDSRLHIPHMMALLDYLNFPQDKLTIIAVDRNKNAATLPTDYLNIIHIPTLIIFEGEKELGRIIESPVNSLEEDLVAIVMGRYTQKN